MAGAEALKRQGSAAETGIREQPDGCFLFCISAFKSSSKHAIATPNLPSSSPMSPVSHLNFPFFFFWFLLCCFLSCLLSSAFNIRNLCLNEIQF